MAENPDDTEPGAEGPENRHNESERRQVPDRRPHSQEKSFPINGFIFREHETAQEAFIIKSGTVEIFKTFDEDGKKAQEVILGTLEAGAMFGEMALIDDDTRMASARAKGGPVSVYVITRDQFENKLSGINPFVTRLLQILAANVRSGSKKAQD